MSVFQRQRVHPMPLKCARGHALVRFELVPCELHKGHRVWVCPMRMGSKPCGDVTVLPPWTGMCNEDEARDD